MVHVTQVVMGRAEVEDLRASVKALKATTVELARDKAVLLDDIKAFKERNASLKGLLNTLIDGVDDLWQRTPDRID